MVINIKRAFLHGYCTRSIYIELPGAESQGGEICRKTREGTLWHPGCPTRMAHRSQE